jgi:hypothetical protein
MKNNILRLGPHSKRNSATAVVSIGLLFLVSAIQSFPGAKTRAALPANVLSAKSIYIENHGSAKDADRAYDELKKWGRWEILQDRAKADLVIVLSSQEGEYSSGQTQTYDPTPAPGMGGAGTWKYGTTHSASAGSAHLDLLDSKTGESLYADTGIVTQRVIKELRKRIEEQEKGSQAK